MASFLPPPAPNDANWEITECRAYIGGPPGFVQNAAMRMGDPMPTSAAAELAVDYVEGDEFLILDDVSAFLPVNGAVNLIETRSDGSIVNHWFTYLRTSDNTTLLYVARIGGPSGPIPAGSAASQWRELTDDGVSVTLAAELQGSTIVHTATIEGVNWNSLVHRQYATVYLEFRYWNSIYRTWSNWIPTFLGYLNPVRPIGFPGYTTWSADAGCEAKLLGILPTVPQQIGNIVIPYTVDASPHLENPLLEPYEGYIAGAQDFGPQHLYDGDKWTPYVSRDAPTTLPALPWYPGEVGGNPMDNRAGVGGVPTDASGYGIKIQTVCLAGVGVNQQDDHYIEIVNMGPDPSGPAFTDDVRTDPDTGVTTIIPAQQDPETWGAVNLGTLSLETAGCRVYLGSKNGSDEAIMLKRNTTAILCRNRKAFEAQNTVPEGTVIVEWGSCDGWMPGLDPSRLHRGIGGSFTLNRAGGWVALREASRGGIRFVANYTLYSPPESFVDTAGDTIATNGELACSASIAGFADSGHLIPQSGYDQTRIYYSGKSGNTFTGCKKVNPDGQSTLPAGTGLRQGVLADKWRDFVAWGNATNPMPFYLQKGDESLVDQNYDGIDAHRVWGYRGSDGYTDSFTSDWVTVEPDGIPLLHAIRRKNAMGGGVYQGLGNAGDGPFSFIEMDGATAEDWEVVQGRPVGNREPSSTLVVIRLRLAEFTAATVESDDTATLDDDGNPQLRISVAAGTALPYPGTLRDGERIRTNQGYDFRYDWRDDSTFYGVRKYNYSSSPPFYDPGDGPEYPAGTSLTYIYDTNPAHWQKQNRAKRLEGRNSYRVAGLDLRRFQRSAVVTVLEDTSRTDGKILLVPGGDLLPVDGGELQATVVSTGAPLTPPPGYAWGEASFEYYPSDSPTFTVEYTSAVGDELHGRIYSRSSPDRYLPPGTTLVLQSAASRLEDCIIRVSRRPNPNDPTTYLGSGQNPDWDDLATVNGLSSDRTYFSLSDGEGNQPPITEIAILARRMSDGGRVKINEAVPYAVIFDPPEQAGSRAQKRGREMNAGVVALEMLRLAGYPPNRRAGGGGPAVRGVKISSGSWWEALEEWATRTGMIVSDGPLGTVTIMEDPRVYGRKVTNTTVVRLGPDAVWGQLEAEEREQFRVSQVTLEATNDVALENYTVSYPSHPTQLGVNGVSIKNKRASSVQAANAWARSIFAQSNGGWRLTIRCGQIGALIDPGDIIRLDVPMDEAGVLFDGVDCLVLGVERQYRSGILLSTVTVERWKTT